MLYDLESLKKINSRYCGSHYLTEADVTMANNYIKVIEESRTANQPQVGDSIQYTTANGDYYMSAHIDKVYENGNVYICEQPYVPFICLNADKNNISCSTSGGAWAELPVKELRYIGTREKRFCDWGSCGACADGAVDFKAKVNVWEYVSPDNKFINSENQKPYTTKEFNKMYVYYNPHRNDSRYVYFGDGHAWETDLEFQAWLRTYRAELFEFGDNQAVVWYWKEESHTVSPKEFESIDLPEDTLLNNGSILRCKRKYDEENHIVHTYWVWYWDEPEKDFYERASEQNKIREEFYTLPWTITPVNQFAVNEINSGVIEPIKLNKLKRLRERT